MDFRDNQIRDRTVGFELVQFHDPGLDQFGKIVTIGSLRAFVDSGSINGTCAWERYGGVLSGIDHKLRRDQSDDNVHNQHYFIGKDIQMLSHFTAMMKAITSSMKCDSRSHPTKIKLIDKANPKRTSNLPNPNGNLMEDFPQTSKFAITLTKTTMIQDRES
ncbi:hypothetical protein WICPIJ_003162 [Wickerhamomyces pijperi]|uniref:Uncharacterized protein n=1 Tax=Wickerhamomyces pijperi TaxID=599730 RepID=A0A9P8Q871_WICPI|nr:hypothetical protein WICPIJ_003162 [Wickerhamomyces pijperi]